MDYPESMDEEGVRLVTTLYHADLITRDEAREMLGLEECGDEASQNFRNAR